MGIHKIRLNRSVHFHALNARHDDTDRGRGMRERRVDVGGRRGERGRDGDVPQVRGKSVTGQPRAREALRDVRDPISRLGLWPPPGAGGVPRRGPSVSQGTRFFVHRARAPSPAPFLEPHSRHTRANEFHRAVRDGRSKGHEAISLVLNAARARLAREARRQTRVGERQTALGMRANASTRRDARLGGRPGDTASERTAPGSPGFSISPPSASSFGVSVT